MSTGPVVTDKGLPPANSNRSLVFRLVRGAAIWAIPLLIVTGIILTWLYRSTTYRSFDDPLVSAVTAIIASAETSDGTLVLSREPLDPRYSRALSGRYWLVGNLREDGEIEIITSSRSLYDASIALPQSDAKRLMVSQGEEIRARTQGPDENEMIRLVARQVILPNMNNEAVIVLAGADSGPAARSIRTFALTALGLMFLITAGLIIAVVTQVRTGLRPLFDLQDKIADVRQGRVGQVDGIYPREIQPLASELNSLIAHNKDVVERAQTHVGNLAHALKTPLAVLQNEAKLSDTDFSNIVGRQTDLMKNQVDHHLRRARAAARGQVIGVSTPVGETLEGLIRTLERIYRDKKIDFKIEMADDLFFRGEKRDLEEMAGNLLDNGCKWTAGRLRVSAQRDPNEAAKFIILVSDDGPGMDEAQFSEAVKRGARLDEATPGTGFGLAIVDDLAKAYNGSLSLSHADMGGLQVKLTLPRVT